MQLSQWSNINLFKTNLDYSEDLLSLSLHSEKGAFFSFEPVGPSTVTKQHRNLMSEMGESKYLLHVPVGRNPPREQPRDLTPCPYSAVSSFNQPIYCDSTLITPISMTRSPAMTTKPAPVMLTDKDVKLSPSAMSPSYHFLADEDDYGGGRYNNPPMKLKDPSGILHMSSADSSFPASPYVCPKPFFGSYGVSATPVSGRSESSPALNPSPPQLHSAGGLSNGSSSFKKESSAKQSPSSYSTQNQAPILIAPSPAALRPATKQDGGPYRQNSLQSTSTTPSSASLAQAPFSELGRSLPSRGKKRKSPPRDLRERNMVLADEKTEEEEYLLELSLGKQLKWKQVQEQFNQAFGKNMQVAALQMRKKRLIERLRVWSEQDERALTLAVEEFDRNRWERIADSMMNYGCAAKWPKDLCQKKWQEMHPEHGSCPPAYEMSFQYQDSEDWGPDELVISEGRASARQSTQEGDSGVQMSTISTATMEEVRSRATSDASSQMLHMRHQHHQQQQLMYDQQQNNGWARENN